MACVLEPHRRPGQAATAESMSVVACTLCTAARAGRHSLTVQRASRMLEAVLDATQLTGADRVLVERAFRSTRVWRLRVAPSFERSTRALVRGGPRHARRVWPFDACMASSRPFARCFISWGSLLYSTLPPLLFCLVLNFLSRPEPL